MSDAAEIARKRLVRFVVLDVIALAIAGGSAVGYFAYDIAPLLFVFVAAVAAGFAAQIWLIMGVLGRKKELG